MGIHVTCPHCNTPRDPDLKKPCEYCKSSQTPLVGYIYPEEKRTFVRLLLGVMVFLLIAIALGGFFLWGTAL